MIALSEGETAERPFHAATFCIISNTVVFVMVACKCVIEMQKK
jgi:hypothetical protein